MLYNKFTVFNRKYFIFSVKLLCLISESITSAQYDSTLLNFDPESRPNFGLNHGYHCSRPTHSGLHTAH